MRRDKVIFLIGALTCLLIAANPAIPALAQASNGHKAVVAPKTLSGREVYEQRKGCIYTVGTDHAQGTGFAVGPFVYTCYHVVAGAKEISLTREGSPPISVKRVIAADRDADIAVLVPDGSLDPGARPVADIGSKAAVGDPLYVIGTPKGLENTFTEGVLSGRRTVGNVEYIQLSAPVSHGSSGSPVFDKYGKIAGMVVSQLKDAQQLNFAVSAATLNALQFGVPISTALRDEVGEDQATSQLALSKLVLTESKSVLAEAPDFSLGMYLSTDAPSYVSRDDIKQWTESELARSAPQARLLVMEDQEQRFKAASVKTALDFIRQYDAEMRHLYVSVIVIEKYSEGRLWFTAYTIKTTFTRPYFTAAGLTVGEVWRKDAEGFIPPSEDVPAKLREAVQKQVHDFTDEWVKGNHSPDSNSGDKP